MKEVIVHVSGGLVQDVIVPKGVVVKIRDYDIQPEDDDDFQSDEDGDRYSEGIWEYEGN